MRVRRPLTKLGVVLATVACGHAAGVADPSVERIRIAPPVAREGFRPHLAGLFQDAVRLHTARRLAASGNADEAEALFREIGGTGPLRNDPTVLDEIGSFLTQRSKPVGSALDAALTAPAPRDRSRREALARALLVLVRGGGEPRAVRAADRLFLELPETPAAKDATIHPAWRERASRATRDDALRRARVFLDAPDAAEALAALKPFPVPDSDAGPAACEARVLLARVLRRLGRGDEALRLARLASARCAGRNASDALYAAVLLLTGREQDPEREVADFERRFPEDTRCDDVLLQRAQLLARRGDLTGSGAALGRIVERHPRGDMADEARFLLAFQRARSGDAAGAVRLLDDAARVAPPGPVADRATYWTARLRAFPRLDRLEATNDAGARRRALTDLEALGKNQVASYHGILARALVARLEPGASLEAPGSPARAALGADASIPVPVRLRNEPDFPSAMALIADGYGREAVIVLDMILDRLDASPGLEDRIGSSERFALAAAYRAAGDDAKSYRLLSPVGGRPSLYLSGRPQGDRLAEWDLLYPTLHATPLATAASRARVPRSLLVALAREESAFDATAVSPTGAIGLCQLQGPASREGASILGQPAPTKEVLLDPAQNAAIGAAYLRKQLDVFQPLLALAAYNRGPSSIATLRRKLALALDAFVESIPARETRDYVKRVSASWAAYAALDAPTERPVVEIDEKAGAGP